MNIAVFDHLDFLCQLKTGESPGFRERGITEEQFQIIKELSLAIYDLNGIPNYMYDATDTTGISCADGFLRLTTDAEKLQWRHMPEGLGSGLPVIYADVQVTDPVDAGDVPRLKNDGTDYVSVTAKLRSTADTSDDSNVITLIDGVSWNIQLREATETNHDVITSHATDPIYDVFEATFTAGVCSFNYYTTNKPAVVYMREADFTILTLPDGQGGTQDYRVGLIHPVIVKVYRVLSLA